MINILKKEYTEAFEAAIKEAEYQKKAFPIMGLISTGLWAPTIYNASKYVKKWGSKGGKAIADFANMANYKKQYKGIERIAKHPAWDRKFFTGKKTASANYTKLAYLLGAKPVKPYVPTAADYKNPVVESQSKVWEKGKAERAALARIAASRKSRAWKAQHPQQVKMLDNPNIDQATRDQILRSYKTWEKKNMRSKMNGVITSDGTWNNIKAFGRATLQETPQMIGNLLNLNPISKGVQYGAKELGWNGIAGALNVGTPVEGLLNKVIRPYDYRRAMEAKYGPAEGRNWLTRMRARFDISTGNKSLYNKGTLSGPAIGKYYTNKFSKPLPNMVPAKLNRTSIPTTYTNPNNRIGQSMTNTLGMPIQQSSIRTNKPYFSRGY